MKLKTLFERSINAVSFDDIKRFKRYNKETDINSDDIEDTGFAKARDKINKYIRNGKIIIYRSIMVIGGTEGVKKRLGTSWAYDIGSAKSYKDNTGGHGTEYIIQAEINEKYVDWDATLSLGTISIRGTYEKEIRLFKRTPLNVVRMYEVRGGLLTQLDDSEIPNIRFMS